MERLDLKQIFDSYNKTGNIPVPASGYSLEDRELFDRAKSLIEVRNSVISSLKEEYSGYGDVEFDISFSENVDAPIYDALSFVENKDNIANKPDVKVCGNFNFSKLATFPAPEAYAMMRYCLRDFVSKFIKIEKEDVSQNGILVKKGQENQVVAAKKDSSILQYLKEFLARALLGVEKDSLEEIVINSDAIESIERDFSKNGITAQDLFENPNGSNLFAERFAKVEKLGHKQQAVALLGEFSKKEFDSVIKGSDDEIKGFCKRFSNKFLQDSGLEVGTYEIDFSNSGDLGNYLDKGENGQKITINIQKIKKLKNPAELMMTLTHELTHMVDSSLNKGEGAKYGLGRHNEVSGVDKNATGFVKRMQEIYYKVNPHERSARRGELVALEFMMGMQPDPTMKKYIERSRTSFKNYQGKVLEAFDKVDGLIAEYESMGLDKKENLSKEERYIVRVMEDLKEMCKDKEEFERQKEIERKAMNQADNLGLAEEGLTME